MSGPDPSDAVLTHVARDPLSGQWLAIGPDAASEYREQGWHVVRVVPIAQAEPSRRT